jgi:hypothetical protein
MASSNWAVVAVTLWKGGWLTVTMTLLEPIRIL